MIKLKSLIKEVQAPTSIVFTKESEYKDFKKYLKTDDPDINWFKRIVQKDIGKHKYSSDTGGWYINVKSREMDELFGRMWSKPLQADWPSVQIA